MNRAAEGLKMGLFHGDDKLMNCCSASEWALQEFLERAHLQHYDISSDRARPPSQLGYGAKPVI
jgi:hypothetical protein